MKFQIIALFRIWISLAMVSCVVAGPGACLSLINATPYPWTLVYQHSYQMRWNPTKSIPAGQSVCDYHEFKWNHPDEAAEAIYELVGHPLHATFTVQARNVGSKKRKSIQIQYNNGLSSLNNPENSLLDLQWQHNGAVAFILAGDGTSTPFISSNPPVAWMQSTLPTIGQMSMREFSMPASHDAGMSELTRSYLGMAHNTLTQTGNVYQQLVKGSRYLDIRPITRHNTWYTHHLSRLFGTYVGGFGRMVSDIVKDINQFTTDYPGELIIVDVSHDMNYNNKWKPLSPNEWQELHALFLGINDIYQAPKDLVDDITALPLSTFIQPGSKSAVLIRLPNAVPLPTASKISGRDLESELEANINATGSYDISTTEDNNANPQALESSIASLTATPTDIPHELPTDLPKLSPVPKSSQSPSTNAKHTLGFFHSSRIPQTGSWSDTDQVEVLSRDQVHKLTTLRPSRADEPLRSTWTITQKVGHLLDVAVRGHSIIGLSAWAHRALFRDMWGNLSAERYPNLIEVDDLWSSQFAALAMAINERFAKVKVLRRGVRVGRLVEKRFQG